MKCKVVVRVCSKGDDGMTDAYWEEYTGIVYDDELAALPELWRARKAGYIAYRKEVEVDKND